MVLSGYAFNLPVIIKLGIIKYFLIYIRVSLPSIDEARILMTV
jgi:hypothetical protein